MSCSISIQNQCRHSAIKAHAGPFQMTNRIMCHEHEHETLMKFNFFQVMELHRYWDSIFDIDLSDRRTWPQKRRKRWKNALSSSMNLRKGWKKALHSSMNSELYSPLEKYCDWLPNICRESDDFRTVLSRDDEMDRLGHSELLESIAGPLSDSLTVIMESSVRFSSLFISLRTSA